MLDPIIQNNTKSLVPAEYYELFALRILGLTYKQISEKTTYSESHIRYLFSSKGVLWSLYRDWVINHKKENTEGALDMLFGHLPDLIKMEIVSAKDPMTMVGLMARHKIFDYTLGKPEDRLKIDAKVGVYTFADWIKAETLKEKENDKSTEQKEISE